MASFLLTWMFALTFPENSLLMDLLRESTGITHWSWLKTAFTFIICMQPHYSDFTLTNLGPLKFLEKEFSSTKVDSFYLLSVNTLHTEARSYSSLTCCSKLPDSSIFYRALLDTQEVYWNTPPHFFVFSKNWSQIRFPSSSPATEALLLKQPRKIGPARKFLDPECPQSAACPTTVFPTVHILLDGLGQAMGPNLVCFL